MGCTEIYSPYIDISMYLEAVLLQTVVLSCQMESIFFLKYVINEGYWGEYFIGVIWILLTFWVSPNWALNFTAQQSKSGNVWQNHKKVWHHIHQSIKDSLHTYIGLLQN